jgi:hypothetical protein
MIRIKANAAVSDTVTSIAEKARYNKKKLFARRYYSCRVIVSGAKEADPASFAPYPDNPGERSGKQYRMRPCGISHPYLQFLKGDEQSASWSIIFM